MTTTCKSSIGQHAATFVYFTAFKNSPLKKVKLVIVILVINPEYNPKWKTTGDDSWDNSMRKTVYNNIILRV